MTCSSQLFRGLVRFLYLTSLQIQHQCLQVHHGNPAPSAVFQITVVREGLFEHGLHA